MSVLMRAEAVSRTFSLGAGLFAARRQLHAVQDVDLEIMRGEVLAIVGESGCGKSTLARMLLGLTPPSAGCITLETAPVAETALVASPIAMSVASTCSPVSVTRGAAPGFPTSTRRSSAIR